MQHLPHLYFIVFFYIGSHLWIFLKLKTEKGLLFLYYLSMNIRVRFWGKYMLIARKHIQFSQSISILLNE